MWIARWLSVLKDHHARHQNAAACRTRKHRRRMTCEALEARYCLSGLEISGLALQNDTGTSGDGVTSDPAITGTATGLSGNPTAVDIEIDVHGDGNIDELMSSQANGSFSFDPTVWISYGEQTIKVRAVELDAEANYHYGDWQTITFTYAPPPNDPAVLTGLSLVTDTGQAGDNITTDATITGTVTNVESLSNVEVEIDLDGDGTAETTVSASGGSFTFDPSDSLSLNQATTIRVRTIEMDMNTYGYITGEWQQITITLVNDPPQVTGLVLTNDTGTAGDNITEDPTISGTFSNDTGLTGIDIEIDMDNDGTADMVVQGNTDGTFSFDPTAWISTGEYTFKVRALEFAGMGEYLVGDWVSITFEVIE